MPKFEKAIHLDAFKLYTEYGAVTKEFLAQFGTKFGKSARTAKRWAEELDWKERAKKPVEEAIQELEAEEKLNAQELISGFLDLCRTRVESIGKKTTYIDAVFSTAFDRIPSKENPEPENSIVVESIEDMERLGNMQVKMVNAEIQLAKLALLLVGEPDSHAEHSGSVNITQAIMDGSYYKES